MVVQISENDSDGTCFGECKSNLAADTTGGLDMKINELWSCA